MPRMNCPTTLAPIPMIILLAAGCAHYQAPRGPAAEALFALYNGDWVLDADASDQAPAVIAGPISFSRAIRTDRGSGGPTLGPPPCPRGQICIDRPKSSEDKEPDPPPVADSARRDTHSKLAGYRASQLTLHFTTSAIRISPTGLGTPLEVPMDSGKTEVDHESGDFSVKAWAEWQGESLRLSISVGDGESRTTDTYELPGDGTMVVTRELGGGSFFLGMTEAPRFVYRRP